MTAHESLVETDWLEANLEDPSLRVYDCTVLFSSPDGKRMQFDSAAEAYAEGHIPGSGLIDVLGDLCDESSSLTTQCPSANAFAAAMSRYGIGDGVRVVLYDRQMMMWSTRVWWMLRGDVPAAVEFGRVAAAPVNTLRQQTHRCQEISVCF